MSSLLVVPLLAVVAGAISIAARFLRRPIPAFLLALFVAASLLPFPRAFVSRRTPLPLDHVTLTTPWVSLGTGPSYNPYLNDVASQVLPWAEAVRLAWKDGALPLRDRWNGCGTPLAANSQSAAFSPFTLISLALPLTAAFLWIGCTKLLLAMAGMWLWLRELGASRGASVFAGIAFALSFSFTQWLFFPQTAVFCLWPWILFLIERCRDTDGRRRSLAALIAALATAALSGHPESLVLGVMFAGIWILARWAAGDLPDAPRLVARVAATAIAAAGLTAFVLLPSLLAIEASNRLVVAAHPHWAPLLSLMPHGPLWRAVVTVFFPKALGDLIHTPVVAGATGAIPEMDLGYFGIVGWAAALLILRPGSRRPRAEWVLAFLLICGLGEAVAQWPFAELFALIPEVRLMFPLRFYSWIALAGPAIAALELDRYRRDLAARPRAAAAAVGIPLLLGACAILVYKHFRPEYAAVGVAFQKQDLLVMLAALALAAASATFTRRRPALFVAGLVLLCAAELAYQWQGLYRLYDPALLYPELPLVRFLREQAPPFRVAGETTSLFPNMNVFARVEDIRTHDPLERRDYVAFLDATLGFPPLDYFKHIGNPDASVLDFLNVRYLVAVRGSAAPGPRWHLVYSGADGQVFENASVLPRAFSPARLHRVARRATDREPLTDANAAFGAAFPEIARNRDWRETAWVLSDGDGESENGRAEILDYRESTNAASLRARVTGTTSTIVLSLVQDGGWSARDENGEAIAVLPANGPFLAVTVPAGEHRVLLRYSPPGFRAGTVISASTLVLLLALAAAIGLRRRSLSPRRT